MKLLHYVLNVINFGNTLFGSIRYVWICQQKCYLRYILFGLLSKLLAALMRNNFPKRPSGAPLHTLSKLYYIPVGFVTPFLLWGCVLLYLWSPKGCCCSISDDLYCSWYTYMHWHCRNIWHHFWSNGTQNQYICNNTFQELSRIESWIIIDCYMSQKTLSFRE